MKPSKTSSASAGSSRPVSRPLTTSTGLPSRPPAVAYSEMPDLIAVAATMPRIGDWPTQTATGQASPRAQYFLRMTSPCLPGSMKTDSVFPSCTMTR